MKAESTIEQQAEALIDIVGMAITRPYGTAQERRGRAKAQVVAYLEKCQKAGAAS